MVIFNKKAFPAFLNHICIEGEDEIGGYFITNNYVDETILNKFILTIIDFINGNLEKLGFGNIFYSKNQTSKK